MSGDDTEHTQIEILLARLRTGQLTAADELIALSYDRFRILSHHILGDFPRVRRFHETGDLSGDLYMKLSKALRSQVPESTLHYRRLAARILRNQCIDLMRKSFGPLGHGRNDVTWSRVSGESGSEIEWLAGSQTHDPARVAEMAEFHLAVQELPSQLQEMFDLVYYSGLSLKDCASSLNVSENTARDRWTKARLAVAKTCDADLAAVRSRNNA